MRPSLVALANREEELHRLPVPLPLDRWLPGGSGWEVELGFGKGRYLLERAGAEPDGRFLGIEVAGKYYRLVRHRMRRRGIGNLVLIRGEALYLLAAALAPGFATAVHVYFPDPWPKSRHQKRRLFERDTVDLVVGLLAPAGRLCFATDYLDYGEQVAALLGSHPDLEVRHSAAWPEGPRTNYEAKYEREGRSILRLEAICRRVVGLHPEGRRSLVAAMAPPPPANDGG